jgi:parallel beta-helix repeat protein
MDSNVSISISDLNLPEEAILLLLEDEEGILNDSLQLLPNQSKILKVQYATPAPIKIESEPEILNQTWIKKINVSSNSSLTYSNVSISSEVDSRVENLTLIFEGIDVSLNDSFEFQFNGTASWKIPELKEAYFELVGSIAQKNVSLQAQIKIENQKDFIFDCNDKKIEGNSEKDSYGILVLNSENVTIANCIVSGFEIGIFVKDSSQTKLLNNIAERNEQGIVFLNSNHNTLLNNIAENNAYHGLIFYSSDDNFLENNRIKSNFDIKILEKLNAMLKG